MKFRKAAAVLAAKIAWIFVKQDRTVMIKKLVLSASLIFAFTGYALADGYHHHHHHYDHHHYHHHHHM